MSKLVQFEVDCDLETFVVYFLDPSWYQRFLNEKLEDLNIQVGDWSSNPGTSNFTRKIRSHHPSKISFPGLPSHAESTKTQSLSIQGQGLSDQTSIVLRIAEINSFRDIPYAEYFNVHLDWTITCKRQTRAQNKSKSSDRMSTKNILNTEKATRNSDTFKDSKADEVSERDQRLVCVVDVVLEFKFFQSTWLQSTIESNTRSELLLVYESWRSFATETSAWARSQYQNLYVFQGETKVPFRLTADPCDNEPAAAGLGDSESKSNSSIQGVTEEPIPLSSPRERRAANSSTKLSETGAIYDEDYEEDLFFDALDGTEHDSLHSLRNADDIQHPSRRPFLSTRDVAVNVVEVFFVLSAFFFWKVHEFYMSIMDLFSVEPKEFIGKVQDTFQYSRGYELTLRKPDLWGPMIAVLCIPHTLLISLEITKNGCNQAAMLGSGVVIAWGFWMGLSILYRLVSFFLAPAIRPAHCFALVGYSFFSWNLALLTSWIMAHVLGLDGWLLKLPLMCCGLPTSLSQGYLFFNKTFPVAVSQGNAITNRTVEFRGVVFTVRQIVKGLVFAVIAGMHFNAFMYLAYVYLQERRQMCHLSFLVEFGKGFTFNPSFFLGDQERK